MLPLKKLDSSPMLPAVYSDLYRDQLTLRPSRVKQSGAGRSPNLGWVFVSNDFRTNESCRTYSTLAAYTESYTYYTPNTFYRSDWREEGALRWINAVVLDVDVKNGENPGLCLPDLLDRINEAGLPCPSFVVQTPSGGFHVYFVLEQPRKAYRNVIAQYKKIQLAMAEAIGADRAAIGAERFFRMPTPQNIRFDSGRKTSFQVLNDWYSLEYAGYSEKRAQGRLGARQGLLEHPAVRKLLEGAEIGKRDNTCYTLALAFKREGFEQDETETKLLEWSARLDDPLTDREVIKKVKSAFKAGAPAGPTTEWIQYLAGEAFTYRPAWEGAKPREERKTSHYYEWANDILDTLCSHVDGVVSGSQRELCATWGMSLSTFQEVLKFLLNLEKITVEVIGKGRGAKTIIRLVKDSKILLFPSPENQKKNVPDPNTLTLEGVAGWLPPGLRLADPPRSRDPS
ncbi:primase C-terminal domain-containing protein [Paenibacillus sp. 1P07SE]|uniref:primase C-terminal domain-containing protein n=1 Tax=Paenibacillus sp. 1P07SE TaxID=3132209 RepID=UPI0039A5AA62